MDADGLRSRVVTAFMAAIADALRAGMPGLNLQLDAACELLPLENLDDFVEDGGPALKNHVQMYVCHLLMVLVADHFARIGLNSLDVCSHRGMCDTEVFIGVSGSFCANDGAAFSNLWLKRSLSV